MPFKTSLSLTMCDPTKDLWMLDKPLVYKSKGKLFTVPVGFICDKASIPRLPLTWWLFKGADTDRPGVLHDWLCRYKVVPRDDADRMFYEALRDEGVGVVRSRMMYWAVRLYSNTVAK